jgi:hypothetical protein
MRKARILWVSILAATPVAAAIAAMGAARVASAQETPAGKPHDMEHMQHSHDGFMQGGMHHATAKGVKLEQKIDGQTITVRVGPLTLPARTSHMKMPQPADLIWQIPVNGWLLAYHPKLVDANGNTVPGIVLHHVAFWNENRPDFLCANKEEHIFGAGSELTDWAEIPGFGYRVEQGDKIRVETMVHNPTETSYENAYLEVTIPYRDASGAPVKNVYPAWMDVTACGHSGYDLPGGESEKTGEVRLKYSGVLLGVGGHMHDYAKQIVLRDVTQKATVATLDAKVDAQGHLVGMPVKTFFELGGYKLAAGDELKMTATYDNTTGKVLRDGAMGIVVGYFVPAEDGPVAALRHGAVPIAEK